MVVIATPFMKPLNSLKSAKCVIGYRPLILCACLFRNEFLFIYIGMYLLAAVRLRPSSWDVGLGRKQDSRGLGHPIQSYN